MKIVAIWNRDRIAPECNSIFILTDDGKFGEFKPEIRHKGFDEQGNRILEPTGNFEFWEEEPLSGNVWTFSQAKLFCKYFGWDLEKVWQEFLEGGEK